MKLRTLKLTRFIALTVVILGITSCQKDEKLSLDSNHLNEKYLFYDQTDFQYITKIGEQLEDPYSVENMKTALKSLSEDKSSGRLTSEIDVRATHLYIRFKPKTQEELNIIEDDSTLILFNFPLDYEIEYAGEYYHDPEVPADQPTYHYAAVTIDHSLTDKVEYEIIRELYIPEEDEELQYSNGRGMSEELIDALVNKSLELTGNLEEEEIDPNGRIASRWHAEGTITFLDTHTNTVIPIEGLKVECYRWYRTKVGHTDSNGDYYCDGPRFKKSANYRIVFEKNNFKILSNNRWIAEIKRDGKTKSRWDYEINAGLGHRAAEIFRAAQYYYYSNIDGLRRPPLNNDILDAKMTIGAMNESSGSNGVHSASRRWFFDGKPWIRIFNNGHDSRTVFGTTIHELAHASHWNMKRSIFYDDNMDVQVKESWARGVQWVITNKVYTGYPGGPTNLPNYTQVVVDLIDPNYSSSVTNQNNGLWNDNVTGYTIRQIEDALKGHKAWNGWRDNIRNKYINGTETNLDALFAHWD